MPKLGDALYVLKATTQSLDCDPAACDVTSDCRVTAGDAFHLLYASMHGFRGLTCHDGCDEVLLCADADAPMCGGFCPDGFGCEEVEKQRKKKKVRMCHKGLLAPWRAKTIKVARWAVPSHLRHGDDLGRCRHYGEHNYTDENGREVEDDSDSDSHDDADIPGEKKEKRPKPVRTQCRCRPAEPPVTTTLPEPTTTTVPGPTTTTVPEPTTTTVPEPTTTTVAGGTTTTTLAADFDNDGIADGYDPCPTDPRNLCYGSVAMDETTALPTRINANSDAGDACSGARTDCTGEMWVDDFGYGLPSVSDACSLPDGCPLDGIDGVFGCSDAATADLIRCERFANVLAGHPPLAYTFDVANGEYLVNLYFANTFGGTALPASRVFDIIVEGEIAYEDFDQIVAAGASGAVVVRFVVVNVIDGALDIGFTVKVENPAIKAIEVLAAAGL